MNCGEVVQSALLGTMSDRDKAEMVNSILNFVHEWIYSKEGEITNSLVVLLWYEECDNSQLFGGQC